MLFAPSPSTMSLPPNAECIFQRTRLASASSAAAMVMPAVSARQAAVLIHFLSVIRLPPSRARPIWDRFRFAVPSRYCLILLMNPDRLVPGSRRRRHCYRGIRAMKRVGLGKQVSVHVDLGGR